MRNSVALLLLLAVAHTISAQGLLPVATDENGQPKLHRDPTSPMTKILGWGVDHSNTNDLHERAQAIREGRAEPMKVDREVLDALFPNPLEIMKRDVDALKDPGLNVEAVLAHLTKLEDMVQDIDNANDLYKIDGINVVIHRLSDHDPQVVAHAAWVLGTLVQSNEKPQNQVLQGGALPLLLNIVKQGSLTPDATKAKAIYALSALVRTNEGCLEAFMTHDGPRTLVDLLRDEKNGLVVRKKAAILVGDTILDDPDLADHYGSLGACDDMFTLLKTQDIDTHDHVLEALYNLVSYSPDNRKNVYNSDGLGKLHAFKTHAQEVAELEEPGRMDHILERIDRVQDVLEREGPPKVVRTS